MRTLWTGFLGFGLVNIPIRLYSGAQARELNLTMLHKDDLSPVRYAKMCLEEGVEITQDQVVKGYEYDKGEYVVLDEDDFSRANVKKTGLIEMVAFAKTEEVDPNYFEKPYYLEPGQGGDRAYTLLREALKKSGKVAISRYVLRNREHLGLVRPAGNLLILNQMRFADEIREPVGLKVPEGTQVQDKEIDLALSLIQQLSGPFDPRIYHDTYTEELRRVIDEKAQGRQPVAHGTLPEPAKVHDLMSLLKASLEQEQAAPQEQAQEEKARKKSGRPRKAS